jgi:hypothetical protein
MVLSSSVCRCAKVFSDAPLLSLFYFYLYLTEVVRGGKFYLQFYALSLEALRHLVNVANILDSSSTDEHEHSARTLFTEIDVMMHGHVKVLLRWRAGWSATKKLMNTNDGL